MGAFPAKGRSWAFQNEEDMQDPMAADEKATRAGAFPRETNTMMTRAIGKMEHGRDWEYAKKMVVDRRMRMANCLTRSYPGESKYVQRHQHSWLRSMIGEKYVPKAPYLKVVGIYKKMNYRISA